LKRVPVYKLKFKKPLLPSLTCIAQNSQGDFFIKCKGIMNVC